MFLKPFLKPQFEENYHKIFILISVTGIFFCSLQTQIKRGGRVAEGARLESVYMATYRGFESLPLCKIKLR